MPPPADVLFASDPTRIGDALGRLQDGEMASARVFSGSDITAHVTLPNRQTYRLGTLNLLSISTHRDKFPVSALGQVSARGFTYGHRTVGGTLVFATFDRSIWHNLLGTHARAETGYLYRDHPDALPPFDIAVTFVNDWGTVAYTGLTGVTLLDEGETYSLESPEVMETYSYMALEKLPFQPMVLGTGGAPAAASAPGSGSPRMQVASAAGPGTDFGDLPADPEADPDLACLAVDTPVTLASGRRAPVGALAPGDAALARDRGGRLRAEAVRTIAVRVQPCLEIGLADGTAFVCSESHELLNPAGGRPLRARDLAPGDALLAAAGGTIAVRALSPRGDAPVALLTLAGPCHTYLAAGVWHHNLSKGA